MKKYEDEETLREMYVEKKMSQREMAGELDCSARTVGRKLDKYGIEARDSGGAGNGRASYIHDPRGYVRAWCRDENTGVYIHQLSAIAGGADPYEVFAEETEVHHKNEIKWDNRPENVGLKGRMDHQAEHIIDSNWAGI